MADSQRFALQKLNNHNYPSWKLKMEMLLIREDTWQVISQAPENPVTEAWTKADAKARAKIGLYIEDDQASLVRNCVTAKQAWDALKTYHDKGSELYLLKKLTHLELKEGDDMEQHLQTFSDLLQRTADVGEAIPGKMQVALLLGSLPDSYKYLATELEQRPREELTLQLVKSKLLAESEKRREQSGAAGSSSGQFAGGVGKQTTETRSCFQCKQPGHLKKDCPNLATDSAASKPGEPKAKQAQAIEVDLTSFFVVSGDSPYLTGNRNLFTVLEE